MPISQCNIQHLVSRSDWLVRFRPPMLAKLTTRTARAAVVSLVSTLSMPFIVDLLRGRVKHRLDHWLASVCWPLCRPNTPSNRLRDISSKWNAWRDPQKAMIGDEFDPLSFFKEATEKIKEGMLGACEDMKTRQTSYVGGALTRSGRAYGYLSFDGRFTRPTYQNCN